MVRIGFAAAAPPCDPHAKASVNIDPRNILLHRNVIAILIQATGDHVLSSAIQWDFVHDFLSNVATLWLWVDTCHFDVDAHQTWIFATSSQGMLPLASQCGHNSHLRTKGPHIMHVPSQFVLTVCQTCCSFCVSGLPKASHTRYRCQALPSPSRQDHLLGTRDVARGERWDHSSKDFPTFSLRQQFQDSSFWTHTGNQA